jgi:O-antigen/teichoic acid export membrane protein
MRLAVLGGARLGAAALGSLGMLVAARAAGPAVIGAWALAQAVQGYAQHAGEFGLRSVVTAEGASTAGGPRALIAPYLRLRLVLTAGVVAAVAGSIAIARPQDAQLIGITLASLFLIALQLDWVPLVEGRALAAALPLLVRPATFLLLILLWPRPLDPCDIASAFVLAWLAAALASMALLGPCPADTRCGSAPPLPTRTMLRRGLGFGTITFLNQLQLSADLLAVGAALGAHDAGIYALAAAATAAISVFAHAGSQLALAGARQRGRGELRRMLLGAILIGSLASAALITAGPLALPWIVGGEFAAAGPLLFWFAPWLLLIHPTGILQSVVSADGRRGRVILANLVLFAVLAPGLVIAAAAGSLWTFALARSVAELARLLTLSLMLADVRAGITGQAVRAGLQQFRPRSCLGHFADHGEAVPGRS